MSTDATHTWLSSAASRDVAPPLVPDVQRLVAEGRAEWMQDRVVHLGSGTQKRLETLRS